MITATISTYNREKYLPIVLDSLVKQTLSKNKFEIILIDNNSPGNTKEISDNFKLKHPEIKFSYYLELNQGLSYARNRGVKEALGKYITFIDDDAFLTENYLEVIYNYFENNYNCIAIGSKIHLYYEDIKPKWENKYLNSLLGYFDIGDKEKEFRRNDYPRGSNMSFRKFIFNEIGFFNVNLGRKGKKLIGGEEKDIFNRIYYSKTKYNVMYIPNAIVYHNVPKERTIASFIKEQAIGTGKSELQRVVDEGILSTIKRFVLELFKWFASIILLFYYLFTFRPEKGFMILRFRWWVSKGLFF